MNPSELKRKRMALLGVIGMLLLPPSTSSALCINNCRPSTTNLMEKSRIDRQSNDFRMRSHNFGENSTNILGDFVVRTGHEHIEIKGIENSPHSVIDSSVNSTVILGNMRQ